MCDRAQRNCLICIVGMDLAGWDRLGPTEFLPHLGHEAVQCVGDTMAPHRYVAAVMLCATLTPVTATVISDQCSYLELVFDVFGNPVYDVAETFSVEPVSPVKLNDGTLVSFQTWTRKVVRVASRPELIHSTCQIRELTTYFVPDGSDGPLIGINKQGGPALIEFLRNRPRIAPNPELPLQDQNNQERDGAPSRIKRDVDGGGVRGSLELSDGYQLTTASPAYAAFLTEPIEGIGFVPFVVDSASLGDTLTFYDADGILWSHALADLELGELYLAVFEGLSASPTGNAIFTAYVRGQGGGVSSVYFPDVVSFVEEVIAVPEPSSLISALIGLAAIGAFRHRGRKARHSSRK